MSRRKNKTHNPLRTKCPFCTALPLPFTLASPGNRFMRLKQQERFTCPLTQEINPKMLTGLERLCLQSPLGNLPLAGRALSWGFGGLGALLGGWWPSASAPTGAHRKVPTSPSPYAGGPGNQHLPKGPTACKQRTCDPGPSDPTAGWGGPGTSPVPSLQTLRLMLTGTQLCWKGQRPSQAGEEDLRPTQNLQAPAHCSQRLEGWWLME